MRMVRVLAGLLVIATAVVILRGHDFARQVEAAPDFAEPAMPMGVLLEPSVQGRTLEAGRAPEFAPGYFTDANGLALYSFDQDADAGKPSCTGDCAGAWPPLVAPAGATPFGDWSIALRDDGAKQWAYKGRPLYRSAKDSKPGETNGNGFDGVWHTVFLADAPDAIASPDGVTVQRLANADGEIFVDQNGMTLYTSDADAAAGKPVCDGTCIKTWKPLLAGELAKPIGDWSLATRTDGTRQWAYRGRPLYAFSGDAKAGDVRGQYAGKQWRPATVRRYFLPAGVATRINEGWPVFVTADGMTLYARDAFRFSGGGGHSVRGDPPPVAATGREIGPGGCTGACTQSWIPLKASADAAASAYWSIVIRDDGTRQWAYQGYPLYTFTQDRKPGDMVGRDLFDLTDGSHALYWRAASP
jgi:predicted lipoprotein with Yx(FWY)xxD motif